MLLGESFQNCFTGSSHYFSQDCSATTVLQVVVITLDLQQLVSCFCFVFFFVIY